MLGVIGALVGIWWYTSALKPVASQPAEKVRVVIASGSSPSAIGRQLQSEGLIRSSLAFDIHTYLTGARGQLQAGTYSLAASQSTEEIVQHLTSGSTDELSITFLPGATLAENRQVLLDAGYTVAEVDAALNKTYDSPLFADKPAQTDLEGYIYGETYSFAAGATVEDILQRTFSEFYTIIQQDDLVAKFSQQGLNLYEGITLASIIQREEPNPDAQKQIAQVFLLRLETEMLLGSDVTYQYAAKKLGITPSHELDSPYNTRIYPGLPPGPISTPSQAALEAVANPASGDYLYFLSGDDDIVYFAHTNDEHEENARNHCIEKCALP
jgi:UPF0755 protein